MEWVPLNNLQSLSLPNFSTLDTENIPAERTATTGLILLGYMENDSENLDIGAHLLIL